MAGKQGGLGPVKKKKEKRKKEKETSKLRQQVVGEGAF